MIHMPLPVTGYHGTSIESANAIMSDEFRLSRNPQDWLGDGVYFFQDGLERSWDWARDRYGSQAAVIGVEIRLDDCIDLLDVTWNRVLAAAHDRFLHLYSQLGLNLPHQTRGVHRLDREVINYVIGVLAERGITIRCVRSAFGEGHPVYPNSAFLRHSHVQIAVRDINTCIVRKWLENPN